MIRESLYFSFAGRPSHDFGILNVSISTGLYEEALFASRSIQETSIRGRDKPYLIEVKREPKVFQLSFAFEDTWNDELIREVARWLDVEYYEPLMFSENEDLVYYAMPVDDVTLIHNGLKQGYFTLTMRCDSPYGYSPEMYNAYDCLTDVTTIQFENRGDGSILPEVFIQKIGDGDLSILNYTNGQSNFVFTDLKDGEELYVHCENEIIESSYTYRYDSFNDNYLSIPYGINNLQVNGKCRLGIRYHYKFK